MNDPVRLQQQILNRDVCLNSLVYLSEYYEEDTRNGTSVNELIFQIENNLTAKEQELIRNKGYSPEQAAKEVEAQRRKLEAICNAVRNDPNMGTLVIANQTQKMVDPVTGKPYEENGIYACTFQDSLENPSEVTVVYRGTDKGEWYDNGIGLSGETVATDQQNQALIYFDTIVERNGWDKTRPDIHMTGHSKGGNKTQFVIMLSTYAYLISLGYSLDGQCMSPEAIAYMREILGEEEFERRRAKLYSISADNDYVNILGALDEGRLIPDENIYFMMSNLSGVSWHEPDCIINKDGTLTEFAEQGIVSKYVEGLSGALMDLPAPLRSIITNGAMGIAQIFNGDPVNGESYSWAEVMAAVPMLLNMLPIGLVEYLGNEFDVNLDWLTNTFMAVTGVIYAPVYLTAYAMGATIDLALALVEKIQEFGKKCAELTQKVVSFVQTQVEKLRTWYNQYFNAEYQYCVQNTVIKLDTATLRDCAQRLRNVNTRISQLDRRMDSLYWQVGLMDLWNILQADLLTGYSWRLSRCATYLENTADDFESVEREIKRRV